MRIERSFARTAAIVLLASTMTAACGRTGITNGSAGAARPSFPPALTPYRVTVDPADFGGAVDNPYFPLTPGVTYSFEGTSEGRNESDVVTVTSNTRSILGVDCVVVRDVVSVSGEVAEKTFDWYAQDRSGNVWYFGEDSAEYENGRAVDRSGSWEAGVDGAQPGVIMPAAPVPGDRYRQEFLEGEAEDMARIVAVDGTATAPFGSFHDVLVTAEWTPLEAGVREKKYYARGIGVVREESVRGPAETLKLVTVTSR